MPRKQTAAEALDNLDKACGEFLDAVAATSPTMARVLGRPKTRPCPDCTEGVRDVGDDWIRCDNCQGTGARS